MITAWMVEVEICHGQSIVQIEGDNDARKDPQRLVTEVTVQKEDRNGYSQTAFLPFDMHSIEEVCVRFGK
jgi:hypothetical protein